jgi:hypothetical protein
MQAISANMKDDLRRPWRWARGLRILWGLTERFSSDPTARAPRNPTTNLARNSRAPENEFGGGGQGTQRGPVYERRARIGIGGWSSEFFELPIRWGELGKARRFGPARHGEPQYERAGEPPGHNLQAEL